MTISEAKKLLISEKHYVLFRLPNEKTAHLVAANHIHAYDTIPSDWSQLRNSFVFAPFSTGKEQFLAIPSEKSHLIEIAGKPMKALESLPTESTPTSEYRQAFKAFSSAIRSRRFQKLVLSRSCDIAIPTQDPIDLFEKAALAYPNAMVYLFHSPQTGHWLGVSPELLIAGDDIQLRTIALAGTLRNNGGTIPIENWGEKERLEQRIVADYIRDRIAGFGTCKDEWGPYSKCGPPLPPSDRFLFSSGGGTTSRFHLRHPSDTCGLRTPQRGVHRLHPTTRRVRQRLLCRLFRHGGRLLPNGTLRQPPLHALR